MMLFHREEIEYWIWNSHWNFSSLKNTAYYSKQFDSIWRSDQLFQKNLELWIHWWRISRRKIRDATKFSKFWNQRSGSIRQQKPASKQNFKNIESPGHGDSWEGIVGTLGKRTNFRARNQCDNHDQAQITESSENLGMRQRLEIPLMAALEQERNLLDRFLNLGRLAIGQSKSFWSSNFFLFFIKLHFFIWSNIYLCFWWPNKISWSKSCR
jgi:hypothetical protein